MTEVDERPEAQDVELALGAVTVAYVHPDEVATSWHQSMLNLIGYDLAHEARIMRGGWVGVRCSSAAGIPGARNEAIESFLDGDAEWLFWVDTDMGFAPDTIDRLLAVADAEERPIVGALCFAQKLDPDRMGGWRSAAVPTIYRWTNREEESGEAGFLSVSDYPPEALVKCAGTGSACILIHRSVFNKIAERDGTGKWYDRVPNPTNGGKPIGEDLSFCLRAGGLGIPVHVHTGVRTTHFKRVWLGEDDYLAEATLRTFFTAKAAEEES